MSRIITTIIPIFMLIGLGAGARRFGFIEDDFVGAANRLVFYLAIPALVFRALCRAALRTQFDAGAILLMLAAVGLVTGLAVACNYWRRPRAGRQDGPRAGTFAQASIHGNLGYIGLAVSYYYLDEAGFARTSMMIGFLMVAQNFLGVVLLQLYGGKGSAGGMRQGRELVARVLLNPVILAAVGGILFNLSGLPLPGVIDRFLMILSGLALPMGLLLIGSALSPELMRRWLPQAGLIAFFKLVLLPTTALVLFRLAGIDGHNQVPVMILLAAPTATLTYVMAREMNGQVELAVAAVSLTTMLSAVSYALWLTLLT